MKLTKSRPPRQCLTLACLAVCIGSISCSSGRSNDRLTNVLADGDVVAELTYEPAEDGIQQDSSTQDIVTIEVEEFVSALLAIDGGAPSWLAIPELSSSEDSDSPDGHTENVGNSLQEIFPPELGEDSRRYLWSLFWTLDMPPESIQLAILNREFAGQTAGNLEYERFRSRYPEYLEELARAWLEINQESRPAELRFK